MVPTRRPRRKRPPLSKTLAHLAGTGDGKGESQSQQVIMSSSLFVAVAVLGTVVVVVVWLYLCFWWLGSSIPARRLACGSRRMGHAGQQSKQRKKTLLCARYRKQELDAHKTIHDFLRRTHAPHLFRLPWTTRLRSRNCKASKYHRSEKSRRQ